MDTIFIITLNFVLDILGCLTVPVPKNFLPFYAIRISSVLIYIAIIISIVSTIVFI